jgi:hypothetical protein
MAADELERVRAQLRARAVAESNGTTGPQPTDEIELRYQLLRSRLLSPDQLEALPPPIAQIEGYCTVNTLVTTVGRPGTAKSLLAKATSFSTVTGQPFFGHAVRQGPVLYVAAEGSAGLAQRQRAWREASGWPALDGMHWLPMAINLLDPSWTGGVVRLVEEIQPVYVVVDTVARSMPGGDENGSIDMGALVAAADRIREVARCTVNLVHHTPREGSTPRGHSTLEGAVDTILLLERSGSTITLTAPKQKDLPTPEPLLFTLLQVGSSVVLTLPKGRGSIPDLVGAERTLRDLVWQSAGSDGLPSGELRRMTGLPERSYYRALSSLVEKGVVCNRGTKGRPRYVGSDEVGEGNTATTAKHCHGSAQTLTANNPPLRGLAVMGDSENDGALDLVEPREDVAQGEEAW